MATMAVFIIEPYGLMNKNSLITEMIEPKLYKWSLDHAKLEFLYIFIFCGRIILLHCHFHPSVDGMVSVR